LFVRIAMPPLDVCHGPGVAALRRIRQQEDQWLEL